VLGAAADLFGKARLMVVCLMLLGAANILGAMSTSFWIAVRLADSGRHRLRRRISGGAQSHQRSGRAGETADRDRPHADGFDDRQPAGSIGLGLIGDFMGWRGVLAVLGMLVIVASAAVLMGFSRRRADEAAPDEPGGAAPRLPHDIRQSECLLLCGGVH